MASLIVAGSTGAIGRSVVQLALRQPGIGKVVALTRAKDVKPTDYEKVFGLKGPLTAAQNNRGEKSAEKDDGAAAAPTSAEWEQQIAKLCPVTLDWEAFVTFWAAYSAHCATAGADAAVPEALQSELTHYQAIFSGHTFAAMCMGTTRSDAGGAKGFIRCDYDYVLAFVEAVMAFSAPGGYPVPRQGHAAVGKSSSASPSLDDGLLFHIGDSTNKCKAAAGQPSAPALTRAAALSTHTLHCLCQVSAANAKSSSWLLYMKTKGAADEAVAERVRQHNTLVAPTADKVMTSPLVHLSYIRPGLLERGEKTRGAEKFAKVFMSAMPVATCGACIVSEFVTHAHNEPAKMKALWADETAAEPFTKPKKKGDKPTEPFYVYHNDQIKKQAQRLDTPSV